jgi:hypothetical protein
MDLMACGGICGAVLAHRIIVSPKAVVGCFFVRLVGLYICILLSIREVQKLPNFFHICSPWPVDGSSIEEGVPDEVLDYVFSSEEDVVVVEVMSQVDQQTPKKRRIPKKEIEHYK